MSGRYEVRAPGASPVRYPRLGQARRVARQVQGASVHELGARHRAGCLFVLFPLAAGLHRVRRSES
jgi:hypothetical protein